MQKQIAVIGVNNGRTLIHHGNKIPTTPNNSEIPMKRIRPADNPATPVWPFATNFCSGRVDLLIPEFINTIASKIWQIHNKVFITFLFTKVRRLYKQEFD